PDLATPVIVARAVMEMGEQVLIAGAAAMRVANEIGIQPAAPGALVTPRSQALLREAQQRNGKLVAMGGGSVGAVARDRTGGFASATSTGGTVYRRSGCIDDSAVPGAGTWADAEVAVSTSGDDAIFRVALAHNIGVRAAHGA